MDIDKLEALLDGLSQGRISKEEALARLRGSVCQSLDFARPDIERHVRQGFAETIFCPGKESAQIVAIAESLLKASDSILATRASKEQATFVEAALPQVTYFEDARLLIIGKPSCESLALPGLEFDVSVVTAGTSDLGVAQEAARVLEYFGMKVWRFFDVGVAGVHRLICEIDEIKKSNAIIVVAGMDGVLPSLVGGLVGCPVIAVPTSVGYGASFDGLAPLLTMLNSCAAGLTVVNIDNGFGAAMAVLRLSRSLSPG